MSHSTLFAFLMLSSQAVLAGHLTVTIEEIDRAGGHLLVLVADSQESWDGTQPRAASRKLAVTGTDAVTIEFPELASGRYAIQVMHDANDNNQLDTNLVGMPIEGYGFSNNPQVMRRARFDEAVFDVPAEGAAITIRLR